MSYHNRLIISIALLSFLNFNSSAQDTFKVVNFSLKDCIEYGMKYHPTVRIYDYSVARSKEDARELLSQYLPQVGVNAGIDDNLKLQQTIIPAGTFGPGTPEQRIAFGTQWNSNMVVQADQKIYDQSLITGLKANKPNKQLAEVNKEENNQSLIYNISSSYFQIIVAQKQLELLLSNKERFEKTLRVTQLQADQGVAKKVDVKQVQVNLNNVLSQISITENNLKLAENTLKNNMGLSQDVQIILKDTAKWVNITSIAKEKSVFDYTRTIGYQQQKLQIDLYDINRKSIRDQIYPSLSFYGRYGALGFGQEFKKAFDPLLDFSVIGIKLSWSAFTGFRRDAQYKKALIDLNTAKENLRYNEELSSLSFQNANLQMNRAQNNIANNKNNMELAREVYDNTSLQYNQGVATLSDLLNAELSYREAQNIYLNSLFDYYLADLDVQKSNGTLREYFNSL